MNLLNARCNIENYLGKEGVCKKALFSTHVLFFSYKAEIMRKIKEAGLVISW